MKPAVALATLALAAAVVACAGVARAEDPVILRYPPSSVRAPLIGGGLAITGVAYGAGFLCAEGWPEVPGSDALKVPVAGPWIAFAMNDCSPDDPDCGFALYLRGVLYVISGFMQLGGLGLVGEGVFMTTESTDAAPKKKPAAVSVTPAPLVGPHHAGVALAGSF